MLKHVYSTRLLFALSLVSALSSDPCFGQDTGRAQPPESYLRMHALTQPLPSYPQDALRQHKEGVSVAQLEIDKFGRVERVSVLQAPSSSIKESLAKTLVQWHFDPISVRGQTFAAIGKLTFYFVIKNSKGLVLNPNEAPYIGRWPETSPMLSERAKSS